MDRLESGLAWKEGIDGEEEDEEGSDDEEVDLFLSENGV